MRLRQKMLVIYFSATGTTKGIAEKIASVTGADLYDLMMMFYLERNDVLYKRNSKRRNKDRKCKRFSRDFTICLSAF